VFIRPLGCKLKSRSYVAPLLKIRRGNIIYSTPEIQLHRISKRHVGVSNGRWLLREGHVILKEPR
jgi:hypothetical protein